MRKSLELIKQETDTSYNDNGSLLGSVEKQYFKYICHDAGDECQLEPIVCRTVDRLNPFDEPVWEADLAQCARCIKANSRVLEDIYS